MYQEKKKLDLETGWYEGQMPSRDSNESHLMDDLMRFLMSTEGNEVGTSLLISITQ